MEPRLTVYPPNRSFTLVDLFCGAGGFTEGFLLSGSAEVGFEVVAASDVSPMVRLTYEGRFKSQLGLQFEFLLRDVREESFTSELRDAVRARVGERGIDVVSGGPPCQGFSVFGRRNESDPRNNLFRPYLRAIEVLQPKYFVMENVPGLIKMYRGKAVERIREAVDAVGPVKYRLSGPVIVNAADYGVPQVRERVVFFGCREDMPVIEGVPAELAPEEYVTVGSAIGDLGFLRPWEAARSYHDDYPASTGYQVQSRSGRLFGKLGIQRVGVELHNHEAAKHIPEVLARFSVLEKGRGLESVPRALWDRYLKTSKKWCVRLDENRPSYTIVTLPDDLVHPTQPRILTVREMARLQSFDDTFIFQGPRSTGGGGAGNRLRAVEVPQYSQVGNAVPPLLAKAIGNAVLRGLMGERDEGGRGAEMSGRSEIRQRSREEAAVASA